MLSLNLHERLTDTACQKEARISPRPARVWKILATAVLFVLLAAMSFAQAPTESYAPTSTANEFYSGGVYARAKTGPGLNDTNFGGWNISTSHYFTPFLGATVDVQGMYSRAPVAPSAFTSSDFLVTKYLYMTGPEFRWHQGRRISGGIRLLAGVSDTNTSTSSGSLSPGELGLFPNATKLALKPGGTFDINLSSRWAIRYAAGVLLEHQNGDFQRDFDLSGGLVFRFGHSL
jgi:hypothetical protein